MKTCSKCGETKPFEDFTKRSVNTDGYSGVCKTCKRSYDNAYYASNEDRRQRIMSANRKRIEKCRHWVHFYLITHPCVDCSESDPVVLEFDHLGDKSFDLSKMIFTHSLTAIKREIGKCVVRCANCHRRKTAKDLGWWRFVIDLDLRAPQ